MIDYTVYNNKTGQVLRSGQVQRQLYDTLIQNADESVLVGELQPDEHFVYLGRAMVRPRIEEVSVQGSVVTFQEPLPEGTQAQIKTRFLNETIAVSGAAFALAFADEAEIVITPPWPYVPIHVQTSSGEFPVPEGAQVIEPDIDRMRAYYVEAVRSRCLELIDVMLGHPSERTRDIWRVKRAIRDRFISGTDTAEDNLAMNQAVLYSNHTVQQELDRIGARINFENWVVLRAEGIREETEQRLLQDQAAVELLETISWAEGESAAAVDEARSMLT